jgi:Na+/proline symporter
MMIFYPQITTQILVLFMFNILLRDITMSNSSKTKRKVKIFTSIMILLYLAILVVASIPSVGAYCTSSSIYRKFNLIIFSSTLPSCVLSQFLSNPSVHVLLLQKVTASSLITLDCTLGEIMCTTETTKESTSATESKSKCSALALLLLQSVIDIGHCGSYTISEFKQF